MADTDSTHPASGVLATVRAAHDTLDRALQATEVPAREGDPRAAARALDALVAAVCVHLGAVEQALHPAVRRFVPGGHALVSAAGLSTRTLERTMRHAEQCLWGDARSAAGTAEGFTAALREALLQRRADDEAWGEALDAVLTPAAREALSARYAVAVRRSPTRPHPHRPHLGPLDGVALRGLGRWDEALDAMDARLVADRTPAHPAPQVTRWGAYALGTGLPAARSGSEDVSGR